MHWRIPRRLHLVTNLLFLADTLLSQEQTLLVTYSDNSFTIFDVDNSRPTPWSITNPPDSFPSVLTSRLSAIEGCATDTAHPHLLALHGKGFTAVVDLRLPLSTNNLVLDKLVTNQVMSTVNQEPINLKRKSRSADHTSCLTASNNVPGHNPAHGPTPSGLGLMVMERYRSVTHVGFAIRSTTPTTPVASTVGTITKAGKKGKCVSKREPDLSPQLVSQHVF